MIYKFADFKVNYMRPNAFLEFRAKDYMCDSDIADFEFNATDEEIEKERIIDVNKNNTMRVEFSLLYRKMAEIFPCHNAFVLHSACFDVDGVGVAFAAHSGTGKTTHMRLWQELLGDKMTIVNGDKPIVRFFDTEPEVPYAYGTPWCGKENLGCNMRTPMKHICFIERAEENSCEPMDASEAIDLIFNQVYMPKDPMAVVNTMQLINRFISSCKLWKIKCNMDISAAEVAYKAIFPEG